jgi:hypothetical protein
LFAGFACRFFLAGFAGLFLAGFSCRFFLGFRVLFSALMFGPYHEFLYYILHKKETIASKLINILTKN